jgi:signal transduction histidine kinase
MRIRVIAGSFILLFSSLSLFGVNSGHSGGLSDLLVKNLLNSDFNQILVKPQDSVKFNQYLKAFSAFEKTKNDSALNFINLAIESAAEAGLMSQVSIALQKKGNFYMSGEDFTSATACFLDAIRIEEKLMNESRIAHLCEAIGHVYYLQEIFGKILEYNEKALSIYQKLNDTLGISTALSHIASAHLSREFCERRSQEQIIVDKETGIKYLKQVMLLCLKTGNKEGVANTNLNIGAAYNRMGKPEIALGYAVKAQDYYLEQKDSSSISSNSFYLGNIYNRLQKYELALKCFKSAEYISERTNEKEGIQFLYEALAQTHANLKDYKDALKYYTQYMTIRDSVYNNEKSRQIFELETRYQTEKKQVEIERLTMVKKQRAWVIFTLLATLLLFSLFGWMAFKNIRNKKTIADQKLELKEQQLIELEKERQLTAAKSVLRGEEAERSRLAGDLHDGLGGLLTGVKLKLFSMKENSIITSENLAHFNHALDLLDSSITEMRRVAHNLMPETLVHYGLGVALADFIKQVEPDGLPVIRMDTFGEVLRYSKELEITLYRISQELVNNAIKHANAKQIAVQLFAEKDRVCIQINDDGIGFDPVKTDTTSTGKGLRNIRDRVLAFNGRFEIFSNPGKGTETTIEFFIP